MKYGYEKHLGEDLCAFKSSFMLQNFLCFAELPVRRVTDSLAEKMLDIFHLFLDHIVYLKKGRCCNED